MDFIRSATLMPFTPRSRKSWDAAATAGLRFWSACACETRLISHLPTLDSESHLSYAKYWAADRGALLPYGSSLLPQDEEPVGPHPNRKRLPAVRGIRSWVRVGETVDGPALDNYRNLKRAGTVRG